MDINDLLVFARVVQAGSFSGASRSLNMPKSTVSRCVANLEDDLGVTLLYRTTRNLRVTEVGAAYYQQGLRIAAEAAKAESLFMNLQSEPQGILKVTAPTEFGNQFLGRVLRDFTRAYKKVSVDLVLTERIVDLIAEGFDVGIRIGALEDSSLIARKLGNADMRLYASPRYLKKRGKPKTCAELRKHRCIVFTGEEVHPKWRLQGPKGSVTLAVSGRIASNNMALVRELAVYGEGIALLPYFFCAEDVKKGRLVPALEEWASVAGPIHAVFPAQRSLLPKTRAFVEHLARALGKSKLLYA